MTSHLLRQRDFSGGEIAPLSYGKTDSPAYEHGLKLALNFIPTLEGPILNRPGSRLVCAVKDSTYAPRLIPFSFSDGQSFVLEVGDQYVRFVQQGVQIPSGGAPYQIASPWIIADVDRLKFAQNGDVITVVCSRGDTTPQRDYQPQEIARLSNTNWTITPVSYSGVAYFGNEPLISVKRNPDSGGTPRAGPAAAISPPLWNAAAIYNVGDFVIWSVSVPILGTLLFLFRSTTDFNFNNAPSGTGPWEFAFWAATTTYAKGDYAWDPIGTNAGNLYVSLVDSNIGEPSADTTGKLWQPASDTSRIPVLRRYAVTRKYQDSNGRTFETLISAATQFNLPITLTSDRPATISLNGDAVAAPANYIDLGYGVYGDHNATGIFGFIGSIAAGGTTFTDDGNVPPDYSHQPPRGTNPFDIATGANTKTQSWPGAFTYHEQRAVPARSNKKPQDFWGSALGNYKRFDLNTPVEDTDTYDFQPASERLEEIRSLLSLRYLLLFTGSSVFGAYGPSGAINPNNIFIRRYKTTGASYLQPLAIEQSALYQTTRNRIYDLNWDWRSDSYVGRDISVIARHLFDGGLSIVDWCYAESPYSMVWAVLSDGRLLSVTYSPDGIAAWAQHSTSGTAAMDFGGGVVQATTANFERVTSVPEPDPITGVVEDAIYVVAKRVVAGATVRYIERFSSRILQLRTPTDVTQAQILPLGLPTGPAAPDVRLANFLDSGLQFDGRNMSANAGAGTAVTMQVSETTFSGGDVVTITASATDANSPLGVAGFNSMQPGDSIVLDPDAILDQRAEGVRFSPLSFTLKVITDATHAIFTADQGVSATDTDPDYDPHGVILAAGTKFWGWGAQQITQLDHLNGNAVNALIDGGEAGPFTVAGGSITLSSPGVIVQVGLGYNSDLQLLDVGADQVKTNVKSVMKVSLEVTDSRGSLAGQDFTDLTKLFEPQQQQVSDGSLPPLTTGNFDITVASSWTQAGSACVRQSVPLPLSITGVVRELEIGGR